jgi:hypothetical protein
MILTHSSGLDSRAASSSSSSTESFRVAIDHRHCFSCPTKGAQRKANVLTTSFKVTARDSLVFVNIIISIVKI